MSARTEHDRACAYAAKLLADTLCAEPPNRLADEHGGLSDARLADLLGGCVRPPRPVEYPAIRVALGQVRSPHAAGIGVDGAGTEYVSWTEPDGAPHNACADCGTALTDDGRGPFYDAATDDGTPHACPS